jgi:predicted SprT family Zn-dependent metalloprotease
MRLSKKTLENRFNKFNERYFGGELIVPKFVIGGSKWTAGEFKCKYYTDYDDEGTEYATELVNIKIYFSKRLIKNSKILDNIMLHEMIHFYGYYMNLDINGDHEDYFLSMAEDINKDGYNVKAFYEVDY